MNPAEVLKSAFAIGMHIEVSGGDLVLDADLPPPNELVQNLVRYKVAIIDLLMPVKIEFNQSNWQSLFDQRVTHSAQINGYDAPNAELCAFEDCVDHWLLLNPPTFLLPGQCLHCTHPVSRQDIHVIPVVGVAQIGSLHPACADKWMISRRWKARRALMWLFKSKKGIQV